MIEQNGCAVGDGHDEDDHGDACAENGEIVEGFHQMS